MNNRIKNIGNFTFKFVTSIYLLTPLALSLTIGGDSLLPVESALCTGLSLINGGLAIKEARQAIR